MNESLHGPPAEAPTAEPQPTLPFRDEAEAPIAYELTARARRTVAPSSLPPLVVVPDTELERPGDTRPARARALRRAGTSVSRIARQLQVDELVVRAWVADVDDRTHHRRPVRPGGSASPARPRVLPTTGPAVATPAPVALSEEEREQAVTAARTRLRQDPDFAAGVALLTALTQDDAHAVNFTTEDLRVARRVVTWLQRTGELQPGDVRVVLRLGSDAAGDVLRHRWSSELGIPLEHVAHTRWRTPPGPGAVEAIVRLPDPALASSLATWRTALLEPEPAADDDF